MLQLRLSSIEDNLTPVLLPSVAWLIAATSGSSRCLRSSWSRLFRHQRGQVLFLVRASIGFAKLLPCRSRHGSGGVMSFCFGQPVVQVLALPRCGGCRTGGVAALMDARCWRPLVVAALAYETVVALNWCSCSTCTFARFGWPRPGLPKRVLWIQRSRHRGAWAGR